MPAGSGMTTMLRLVSAHFLAYFWFASLSKPSYAESSAPGTKCYVLQHNLADWMNGFEYEAGFPGEGLAATGCPPQNINMTRLFMKGACVGTRINNFASLPDCTAHNGSVVNVSSEVCQKVFSAAPEGTIVNMLDYKRGEMFDKGKVCSSSEAGFFFVQTTCPTFSKAQFLFSQSKYRGGVCNKGKALSTGAIVGIAIGCLVFVAALVAVIFLWMRSRKLNRLAAKMAEAAKVGGPPAAAPAGNLDANARV